MSTYNCREFRQTIPNPSSIYEPLNCRVILDLHGSSEWENDGITMERRERNEGIMFKNWREATCNNDSTKNRSYNGNTGERQGCRLQHGTLVGCLIIRIMLTPINEPDGNTRERGHTARAQSYTELRGR